MNWIYSYNYNSLHIIIILQMLLSELEALKKKGVVSLENIN